MYGVNDGAPVNDSTGGLQNDENNEIGHQSATSARFQEMMVKIRKRVCDFVWFKRSCQIRAFPLN